MRAPIPHSGSLAVVVAAGCLSCTTFLKIEPRSPAAPASGAPRATLVGALPPGATVATLEHGSTIRCLSFSADARRLLSGSEDNLIVWDLDTSRPIRRFDVVDTTACALFPDGRRLAVVHFGAATIIDVDSGASQDLDGSVVQGAPNSIAVAPDGLEVLVAAHDGVHAFDVTTRHRTSLVGSGAGYFVSVAFADEHRRLAATDEGWITEWRGTEEVRSFHPVEALDYDLEVMPLPGDRVLVSSESGLLVVGANSLVSKLAPSASSADVNREDGTIVAAVRDTATVFAPGGAPRGNCPVPGGARITTFAPDGRTFAVGIHDGSIALVATRDCSVVATLGGHRALIADVDARSSLLVGLNSGWVTEWTLSDFVMVRSTRPWDDVTGVAFLTDGRWASIGIRHDASFAITSLQVTAPYYVEGMFFNGPVRSLSDNSLVVSSGPMGAWFVPPDWARAERLSSHDPRTLAAAHWVPEFLVASDKRIEEFSRGKGGRSDSFDLRIGSFALGYSPDDATWAACDGNRVVLRERSTGRVLRTFTISVSFDLCTALQIAGGRIWVGFRTGQLLAWDLKASDASPALSELEGGKIVAMAATTDQRFLVIAHLDRVVVRALPSGARVADLAVMRDGSWAALRADGTFQASGLDASSLPFVDPRDHLIGTLRDLGGFEVSTPALSRVPSGSTRVRATVVASGGKPAAKLDGFDVESLRASAMQLNAYEIDVLVQDPSARTHTLEVTSPSGAVAKKSFATIADVGVERVRSGKGKALLIGNSSYPGGVPLSSRADAETLAQALHSSNSWRIAPETRFDLGHDQMVSTITNFLGSAALDDVLLLYYAGHGASDAGDGFLVPTDYTDGHREKLISAKQLWDWLSHCPASQIVVVIDACDAGAFSLPAELDAKAQQDHRVLFVVSSSAGVVARGAEQSFTKAFVSALTDPTSVDSRLGAVTVHRAFYRAEGVSFEQHPALMGARELDDLPLAWPEPSESREIARFATADVRGRYVEGMGIVESRQLSVAPSVVANARERVLLLSVVMGEDAASLHLSMFKPGHSDAVVESKFDAPKGSLFRKRERFTLSYTLPGDLPIGPYRLEIKGCSVDGNCVDGAPAIRRIDL